MMFTVPSVSKLSQEVMSKGITYMCHALWKGGLMHPRGKKKKNRVRARSLNWVITRCICKLVNFLHI